MRTVESVWDSCLQYIRQQVPDQSYRTWFDPIRAVKLEGSVLTVQVPSQFFYEWLEDRYVHLLRATILQELGESGRLEYQIMVDRSTNNSYTLSQSHNGLLDVKPTTGTLDQGQSFNHYALPGIKEFDSNLNAQYTFDTYVEGECNQLARSAGVAVAKRPGKTPFNPLTLYSSSGLGKTHLVQAIGNYVKETFKDKTVLYVSADQFTNQFIDSVKNGSTSEFTNFYRTIDVLIVDDIQFFANKDRTQDIFFHTFNYLHQNGKQIIMTSDRPLSELTDMEERLISRFKWGLVADLQLPDLETRIAILEKKLHAIDMELPRELVEYIAHNVKTNVREMEGVVISMMAQASLRNRAIDLSLAQIVVQAFINKNDTQPLTVDYIKKITADYFKTTVEALEDSSRKREIVQARQVAMFLCKKYTDKSLKAIGEAFGKRDHSTVIHALQSVADWSETDSEFRNQVKYLERQLDGIGI